MADEVENPESPVRKAPLYDEEKGARFVTGVEATAFFGFVPAATIGAIQIWVFGDYGIKFGPFELWAIDLLMAGVVTIFALFAFGFSFPLFHRSAKDKSKRRYILSVAVAVGVMWLLLWLGFASWVSGWFHPESSGSMFGGFFIAPPLAYLPGLLCAIVILRLPGAPNQAVEPPLS